MSTKELQSVLKGKKEHSQKRQGKRQKHTDTKQMLKLSDRGFTIAVINTLWTLL